MKKITFFALMMIFSSVISANAADVVLNDFESGSPTVSLGGTSWGGSFTNVPNPAPSGVNSTANCLKVGRTNQTWYEAIMFTPANSYTVNESAKGYIHILVNCAYGANFRIKYNSSGYIYPINSYVSDGTWQDLVFEITGPTGGVTITSLKVYFDCGDGTNGSGVLDNLTKFAYIDEIIANESFLPRGKSYQAINNLYDFESGTVANISGITTFADGTNNIVTYPVTNPYQAGINPTANVGKRTLVDASSAIVWYAGFTFSFTNLLQIDDTHKYLHIMMVVPVDGQQVAFDVKQGGTKVIADQLVTITTANTWQDVVIDVSAYTYISGVSIKCGTSAATAAGDYYFDQIYIDGNANPRQSISASLNSTVQNQSVYSKNGTIVIENEGFSGLVTVRNVIGQIIYNKLVQNNAEIPVNKKGIYLVTTLDKTTKVLVN